MTSIKRNYKSSMFCMLRECKEDLLSLYNAVNGTHYTNADELIINTLRNAIYMGMKNDMSFIFDMSLNLYEHQSTVNPNMPIEQAVHRAVDECIATDILADFLLRNKAEAIAMSIFEYDQEAHMKHVRKEGYEDGLADGISQNRLANLQSLMKNLHLTATEAMDVLEISPEERAQYIALL